MSEPSQPPTTAWLLEQHLLQQVVNRGPMSRAELTALTGLPRSTVVNAVQPLIQRGTLRELPEGAGRRGRAVGRPAILLDLAEPTGVIVLELGRRDSQISILRDDDIQQVSLAITYRAELAVITAAVAKGLKSLRFGTRRRPELAVISLPLPLRGDRTQPVFLPSTTDTLSGHWVHDPIPALRTALGCEVLLENDGNMAAFGEAHSGAGRGFHSVLHLSLRDGLGSGMVIGGQLVRGASGIAGELVHVSVQEDGKQCLCGNRGCLLTFESGPLLVDTVSDVYGTPLTFPDIQQMASRGDPAVHRILTDFGRRVGEPIAVLTSMLNLDRVLVDARLGGAGAAVAAGIDDVLGRRVSPMAYQDIRVVLGECGENAIASGGFALARERLLRSQTGSPRTARVPESATNGVVADAEPWSAQS